MESSSYSETLVSTRSCTLRWQPEHAQQRCYASTYLVSLQITSRLLASITLVSQSSSRESGLWRLACVCTTSPVRRSSSEPLGLFLTAWVLSQSRTLHSLLLRDAFRLLPPTARLNATPENIWGCLHGFIGLGFAIWWQLTVQIAAAMRGAMMRQ